MASTAGLINPTSGRPLATACWLASAVKPAHNGAAQLVPPTFQSPPSARTYTLSAVRATSGMFRIVVEPWFSVMLMSVW